MKRVKLRDVADMAGVSIQTVSRVVRGVDAVADETRERVMAAVQELNYQPNLAARSLSAHRTGSVHVIDAVPLFHGHAATFVAICQQLAALDLHISTTVAPFGFSETPDPRDLVPLSADGIIILGGRADSPAWVAEIAAATPTVVVGRAHDLPATSVGVAVDHKEGAKQAVAHLLGRGSRRIVHIAGPLDWMDAALRLEGYREACAEAGIPERVLHAESWDASAAYPLIEGLEQGSFDGVFAANDQLALGCLGMLQRRGIAIPREVRVVGFDDMAGADALFPSLTTLRQDFSRVGELAVDALKLMLEGNRPRRRSSRPPSSSANQPERNTRALRTHDPSPAPRCPRTRRSRRQDPDR
ncbi:LacI family transcriptional regulator [Tessaracoccus sp. HDW20]|uniref:LacI family DNA-binding transcriptional regulator n=1 Tax=Tessaracoccus coleopterorum TaxID=2714950 RepID=UPI0018D41526|nr:LacI family transcriptional regulator [Tessaracoccus coleopterorum]